LIKGKSDVEQHRFIVRLRGGPADGSTFETEDATRFIDIPVKQKGGRAVARYERVPTDGSALEYRFVPTGEGQEPG
jgi:hypothetical protein